MRKGERWDLLAWPAGGSDPPVILAYGVTLHERSLDAEIVTVTRKAKQADRRVELRHQDGSKKTITIRWDDCLKPRRWGNATFTVL